MNFSNLLGYLEWLIYLYFAFTVLYTLILSLGASFLYKDQSGGITEPQAKIAIIVPAYKEDSIILNTLQEHLTLNYPQDRFRVFLCADSFQPSTLEKIRNLPITLVEVSFEVSTVTKSVKQGVAQINPEEFPITLICDADNVLEKDFLIKLNSGFQKGMKAIQGRRYTKNLNSPMAVLDSISEMINNHIFRKGAYGLGLSSALIGSGMAFETSLLKDCLLNNHSIGGYDRELQLSLCDKKVKIHYMESAICFDEKISTMKAFGNQRKRWLSSQFMDLRDHFLDSFKKLFLDGNISYFNLGFIGNLFLSRIITLGLLVVFSLGSLILYFTGGGLIGFNPLYWFMLLALYALALGLGIPRRFFNGQLAQALLSLPGAFLQMFALLFRLKGANKKFIHTEHHVLGVDETLLNKK
jgi:cellulose synthase/poly-beta-1,6-N-acetylglucosamine synthase-like glycosyltransferase